MFRQNKIHFISLGCARNLVDTEVMLGITLQAGYEIVSACDQAHFIVVNTCGFLEASRKEALDTIAEVLAVKKKKAKVIVAGCMVRKHKDLLQEKFPQIHYYLSSGDVGKILDAVRSEESGEAIGDTRSYLNLGEIPRVLSTPSNYAYLKIAEGCKKRCAFCIIPYIKGPLQSKPEQQVIKEFHSLLDRGVHEIILIAQDLGDYGKDTRSPNGLENLLTKMLKTEKDFWLRLLYLYPDEITDSLIDLIKSDPRICPYIDMPIQHINDVVLKAMHRKTHRAQIEKIITKLRTEIPDMVIRTSLMVGFPGETEEQFQELLEFIEDYPLDHIGIFTYSKEEQSYSATLPNHISEDVKQRRQEVLAAKQQEMVKKQLSRCIGRKLLTMIEGYHADSSLLLRGRFRGQAPDVDGEIIINDWREVDAFGRLYEVEITDVVGYDLLGRVINKAPLIAPSQDSLLKVIQ